MPSSITHLLIAEDASKSFAPKIGNAVRTHPDYFYLGAQGPDPFFFLKILSKEKNFGSLLHDVPYETFTAFFSRYRSAPDEAAAVTFYETAVRETVRLVSLFFSDALPKIDFSKNLHTGK